MASDIRITDSNSAYVPADTTALTRWPVYTTKHDILSDLFDAMGGGRNAVWDVIQRLGNTDTSTLTDIGSHPA